MHAPQDINITLNTLEDRILELAERVTVLERSVNGASDPYVWIGLTVKQARAAAALMNRDGYISRAELMAAIYGKYPPSEKTLDGLIANLRRHLRAALVASRGRGWMLTDLEKATINRRLAVGRL